MIVKRKRKIKAHHIYIASALNTSVFSLATLHFTNGCMVSLALFGGVGSSMVMIFITNLLNDRIEQKERKSDAQNEHEVFCEFGK